MRERQLRLVTDEVRLLSSLRTGGGAINQPTRTLRSQQGYAAGDANTLRAEFRKVVWVEEERPFNERFLGPKYVPQYTPVGSTDFQTNAQGQARLSFTPPEPGTYSLLVSGDT